MSRRLILNTAIAAVTLATVAPTAQAASPVPQTISSKVTASSTFRQKFIDQRVGKFINPGKLKMAEFTKEAFVKDAHPRGPSWVNSPRGIDKVGKIVNPAINVQKAFARNIVR